MQTLEIPSKEQRQLHEYQVKTYKLYDDLKFYNDKPRVLKTPFWF